MEVGRRRADLDAAEPILCDYICWVCAEWSKGRDWSYSVWLTVRKCSTDGTGEMGMSKRIQPDGSRNVDAIIDHRATGFISHLDLSLPPYT